MNRIMFDRLMMVRCCLAIGGGAVLGLLLVAGAFLISEQFDTQLVPF